MEEDRVLEGSKGGTGRVMGDGGRGARRVLEGSDRWRTLWFCQVPQVYWVFSVERTWEAWSPPTTKARGPLLVA